MIPRVVIAGTSSGAGKTSVACGLIGALRGRGLRVQGFKVGPDYIDPSHHALAAGRPGRNLDAFLSGPELIAPLFRYGSQGADIAVVEGVMGMFDGASGRGQLASTAHVAKLLDAPVLLVLDAAAMSRSAAAIVHGFRAFDPDVRLAGVVFNRVGSEHHERLLREALEELPGPALPALGALRRDERVLAPERHLGLVPAAEREPQARAALEALAEAARRYMDLDAIEAIARAAPQLPGEHWSPQPTPEPEGPPAVGARSDPPPAAAPVRIAVAGGPAFSFHYEENLELLRAAGAELARFDPLAEERLPPDSDALLLAGGFPEVYGAELAANAGLRAEVAAFAASGRPVLAECGGLLYLCERLDDHEMCGAIAAHARMGTRLALGYREARAATATPWLGEGEPMRGHEFHYTQVEPLDRERTAVVHGATSTSKAGRAGAIAPETVGASGPAWVLSARGVERAEGFVRGAVQASYLHVHWAAHPHLASRFVAAARDAGSARAGEAAASSTARGATLDEVAARARAAVGAS